MPDLLCDKREERRKPESEMCRAHVGWRVVLCTRCRRGRVSESQKRNMGWDGESEESACPLFLLPSSGPDIKRLYHQAGVELKATSFLFVDTQIADESFLEDINNILSSGEVPNLYKTDEFEEVRSLPHPLPVGSWAFPTNP